MKQVLRLRNLAGPAVLLWSRAFDRFFKFFLALALFTSNGFLFVRRPTAAAVVLCKRPCLVRIGLNQGFNKVNLTYCYDPSTVYRFADPDCATIFNLVGRKSHKVCFHVMIYRVSCFFQSTWPGLWQPDHSFTVVSWMASLTCPPLGSRPLNHSHL